MEKRRNYLSYYVNCWERNKKTNLPTNLNGLIWLNPDSLTWEWMIYGSMEVWDLALYILNNLSNEDWKITLYRIGVQPLVAMNIAIYIGSSKRILVWNSIQHHWAFFHRTALSRWRCRSNHLPIANSRVSFDDSVLCPFCPDHIGDEYHYCFLCTFFLWRTS